VRRPAQSVTQLLVKWRSGDQEALQALIPLVYDELRRLAHNYLRAEPPVHTLQSTALAHEAYMGMVDHNPAQFHIRAYFLAVATTLMRRILLDYARPRRAARRGLEYKVELD
jgi:RNA polymerase sigma factor (TIGR02999 family)